MTEEQKNIINNETKKLPFVVKILSLVWIILLLVDLLQLLRIKFLNKWVFGISFILSKYLSGPLENYIPQLILLMVEFLVFGFLLYGIYCLLNGKRWSKVLILILAVIFLVQPLLFSMYLRGAPLYYLLRFIFSEVYFEFLIRNPFSLIGSILGLFSIIYFLFNKKVREAFK